MIFVIFIQLQHVRNILNLSKLYKMHIFARTSLVIIPLCSILTGMILQILYLCCLMMALCKESHSCMDRLKVLFHKAGSFAAGCRLDGSVSISLSWTGGWEEEVAHVSGCICSQFVAWPSRFTGQSGTKALLTQNNTVRIISASAAGIYSPTLGFMAIFRGVPVTEGKQQGKTPNLAFVNPQRLLEFVLAATEYWPTASRLALSVLGFSVSLQGFKCSVSNNPTLMPPKTTHS